jgi:hypothetical protein
MGSTEKRPIHFSGKNTGAAWTWLFNVLPIDKIQTIKLTASADDRPSKQTSLSLAMSETGSKAENLQLRICFPLTLIVTIKRRVDRRRSQ